MPRASRCWPAAPLLQPTIVDVLLGDHRDTVALLKHFEQVGGR
jgi:hypothetical protein